MKIPGTFIIALLLSLSAAARQDTLFRIEDQGKVGYINAQGRVVIPTKYHSGEAFSEGLAAVRENGYYGFIDTRGNYVLEPQFDKAAHFQNGVSLVTRKGKPTIIDRTGTAIAPPVYKTLEFVGPRKAIVHTESGHVGLLDIPTRKLVLDTIYWRMEVFDKGVAVVEKYNPRSKRSRSPQYSVIDTNGRVIVPFGRYFKINPFSQGYAIADSKSRKWDEMGDYVLIDSKGRELFRQYPKDYDLIWGTYHEGRIRISLVNGTDHEGYIDIRGKVVLDNTLYTNVTEFSRGRAFARTKEELYYLIDTAFRVLNKDPYRGVEEDPFRTPYAAVDTETGWGVIDKSGTFVVKPTLPYIDRIVGDFVYFGMDEGEGDKGPFGVITIGEKPVINPVMQQYDRRGFVNGLLLAVVDDRLTWFNEAGQQVWQAQQDTTTHLRRLNIDFMLRAHCSAYSTLGKDGEFNSGGWATSGNFPQKTLPGRQQQPNRLSVVIDTMRVDTFGWRYNGYPLYVMNTTADTLQFRAVDSRLYLKMQAQDEKGQWQDIQYMPSSFCGNSYHTIQLEPAAHWKFVVPDLEGELSTYIRVELKYLDPRNPEKEKILYSNIIRGSINPAQFTNKQSYYRTGIMDPYID
ncbi:WG repeat-containing protein [Paraflavitalea sp. CAU 1676]|uniref:WG repeat-containing protein n=1 Tax=Paraflavitalea sp. CAU 1676 TaxID=3032598 RepID=UPI0023DCCE77|nr:WG repeat-containing protein [Paraflavitalea sp. CAU 1676]MDF2192522.1 WG repeat-containing protein [Paraflavitalea sp. CAU 1676]